jgi:dihydroorotate dehydrogenase
MYSTIRELLFLLDPEYAHDLACKGLQQAARLGKFNPLRQEVSAKPHTIKHLTFPNRIGLAAGMDKNGDYIDGFAALGFGFIEIGTATLSEQSGNPKPRITVSASSPEIKNTMGMPNKGVLYALNKLNRAKTTIPTGVSIAPNTFSVSPIDNMVLSFRDAYRSSDFITVNISCPNVYVEYAYADALKAISHERNRLGCERKVRPPLVFVKIPAQFDNFESMQEMIWRIKVRGFDGVICANTYKGVTQKQALWNTLRQIKIVRSHAPTLTVIASGGIMTPFDAACAINCGADLVQIYTSLVFNGPRIVKKMAEAVE